MPRRVSGECLVAYEGNHDSVPYPHGGRPVPLRVRQEQAVLEIGAEETWLAVHPLLLGHGHQSLHPDHLSGLWSLTLQGKEQRACPTPLPREEATGPLRLSQLPPMPEVEVRPPEYLYRPGGGGVRMTPDQERLHSHLCRLKLHRMEQVLGTVAEDATKAQLSYTEIPT